MKLPRDVSGAELARALSHVGYRVTRQTGSHMRLTHVTEPVHHMTIPAHRQLKLGTLSGILGEVAGHLGISRDELLRQLFGD